ncbi:MAG: hypothetical protein IIA67_04025 [Planctomycetes bacterium]|nr:hypothetical protein [Planctomycetota bacterium]
MDFAARTTAARWRGLIAAAILALAIVPAIPLLIAALRGSSDYSLWSDVFIKALLASLALATGVAVVSLGLGLPLGLLAALYGPRRRPILLVAQALPLLLPSFLLAIGWRHLPAVGLPKGLFPPSGFGGAALVMGLQAAPLPLLATWAACRNLTASQIDAARLHGGEQIVLTRAAMACAPVAIVAALLAGILSLSDPGAAQVFRCPSAAMEIRTSFAALGDRVLAARQCLVMAGLALLLTAPVLLVGLPHLAAAVLAKQTRPVLPYRHPLLGRVGHRPRIALEVPVVLRSIGQTTAERFVNEYIDSLRYDKPDAFRSKFRNLDCLLIDDVQFLADRETCQDEFFHTFNVLYQSRRQILLSADVSPAEIPALEERLVSRFNWGLVAHTAPPDRETRRAILQRKAELRGYQVPNDLLDMIAESIDSNVRMLEGALTRLVMQSQLTGAPLTPELVTEVLEDLGARPKRQLQVGDILDMVSSYYGIRRAELLGKKRTRSVVQPRRCSSRLSSYPSPSSPTDPMYLERSPSFWHVTTALATCPPALVISL